MTPSPPSTLHPDSQCHRQPGPQGASQDPLTPGPHKKVASFHGRVCPEVPWDHPRPDAGSAQTPEERPLSAPPGTPSSLAPPSAGCRVALQCCAHSALGSSSSEAQKRPKSSHWPQRPGVSRAMNSFGGRTQLALLRNPLSDDVSDSEGSLAWQVARSKGKKALLHPGNSVSLCLVRHRVPDSRVGQQPRPHPRPVPRTAPSEVAASSPAWLLPLPPPRPRSAPSDFPVGPQRCQGRPEVAGTQGGRSCPAPHAGWDRERFPGSTFPLRVRTEPVLPETWGPFSQGHSCSDPCFHSRVGLAF